MLQYALQEAAWAIDAQIYGVVDGSIHEISIDSRTIGNGRGVLFFALQGPRHNGHDYVEQLYRKKGVRCFVISEIRAEFHDLPNATFLEVSDTLQALQQFAGYHRQRFDIPVVAVTGSNGKTIVKEWLHDALAPYKRVHHSPKSFNSQVGVALSLLGLMPEYEMGIYEAGISLPGEMARLQAMIRPTIGIFTNLGHAHQEGFRSMEEKCREKLTLFKGCAKLLLCRDQEMVYNEAERMLVPLGVQLVTWSRRGADADLSVTIGNSGDNSLHYTPFSACYHGANFTGELPGRDGASIENALHTLLALLELGLTPEQATVSLAHLQPLAMRLERRVGANGLALINDSYSNDIESLTVALDFLSQNAGTHEKALILSDIEQSGLPADTLYSLVASKVQQHAINRFIGVGPELTAHRELFPQGEFYPDTDALLAQYSHTSFGDYATLVKGARNYGFERVCKALEMRRHRTVMEIDLGALTNNLNYFRSLLPADTKLLVLVKAWAYGCGMVEVAQFLEYHKVDYLGVAFADEGVTLRAAGISTPILVLNPEPESYTLLIANHLEPEIFSMAAAEEFAKVAANANRTDYPIHIKFDTGMHRVGFNPQQIDELAALLANSPALHVASVMTHLCVADDPDEDAFTNGQLELFDRMADTLERHLGYHPLRHALNSAGIERFTAHTHDMVRLGIGLHGFSAAGAKELRPVASLHSFVAQLRQLNVGDTVGYGRRGVIARPSLIATIPIGYADGYTRRLGRGVGKVAINGVLCPTIGNICMDTCMVDATGVEVHEGDKVTIFGAAPTLLEVSQWLDTIPYEVLSTISRRIPRVYIES